MLVHLKKPLQLLIAVRHVGVLLKNLQVQNHLWTCNLNKEWSRTHKVATQKHTLKNFTYHIPNIIFKRVYVGYKYGITVIPEGLIDFLERRDRMIGATMSMKTDSKQKNKKSKTESDFCIVSEYLKGGSLRSYLEKNRKKKLPLKIVIRFALDIAKGLSYLHSEKIIHRDVKPDNMLMDEKKLIKLADFGESVVEPLYMKSCEVGTLGYMAPEVLSRKPYSHKCDVYAFGICLWEIQCCDMAYTYDLENIPSDIYKELRPSIPLDCPRSLANLMEQCWHTDPSKRPEMKDVVIELEKIGKAEGLQTQSEDREAVYGCFCVFRH
ncbi:serine/threonine-protein kinase HT1-like protein [Tanacetum coccineum]